MSKYLPWMKDPPPPEDTRTKFNRLYYKLHSYDEKNVADYEKSLKTIVNELLIFTDKKNRRSLKGDQACCRYLNELFNLQYRGCSEKHFEALLSESKSYARTTFAYRRNKGVKPFPTNVEQFKDWFGII